MEYNSKHALCQWIFPGDRPSEKNLLCLVRNQGDGAVAGMVLTPKVK